MPRSSPAVFRRLVVSWSSVDGYTLPDGWLWATMVGDSISHRYKCCTDGYGDWWFP